MRLGLTVLLSLVLGASALAQEAASKPLTSAQPVKVAEGAYENYNSWTLWRIGDHYKVETQIFWADMKGEQRETLELTRDFYMQRIRYEVNHFGALPDGALECVVNKKSFDCTTTMRGKEGRGSIPVAGAYAAQFGVHVALFDLTWFYTTLVANGIRKLDSPSTAGVVSVAYDGVTPDNLVTATTADAIILYLGTQPLPVLDRKLPAHRFQVKTRHYDAIVWTADNGFVLAIDMDGMPIRLRRFKQYENFVPELKGAKEEIAPSRIRKFYTNLED